MTNQAQYSQARINKDRNYDGSFYFGVLTTGIFCRPSCPSPIAKEENVLYFDNILQAMDQGFRPCLRCRPEITTDYLGKDVDGHELVTSAMSLIHDGFLNDHKVSDLADILYTSERTLRHQFSGHLGISPIQAANYQRSLFARRLLLSTKMKVTDVAFASGFSSLRQFNETFRKHFRSSPTELRTRSPISSHDHMLRIPYDPAFDFHAAIGFMKPRALTGVEVISDDSYTRTFRMGHAKGYFTVKHLPEDQCLGLSVITDDVRVLMPIYRQVRRMFDLNTDFNRIQQHLSSDPLLAEGMKQGKVPPMPVAFNAFEFVIRAILGQVVSVSYATTLAIQLTVNNGQPTPEDYPQGLTHFFPMPEEMSQPDYTNMGMTKSKITAIEQVVTGLTEGTLTLTPYQSFDEFKKAFIALKGIGDWTVNYVAMRALGMKDAFPYNDLGVIKALSTGDHKASAKEIKDRAEAWKPYRAYATLCLWHR